MITKTFIAAAAAGLALAAAPAGAATTMTYATTGNTNTYGTAGNSATYSITSGGHTYHMRASAFSSVNGTIETAYLGQYSAGLGVTSSTDGYGLLNQHTTDNFGGVDFIMLQFDSNVQLVSATLTPFSLFAGLPADNDATIGYATTTQAWNGALNTSDSTLMDAMLASLYSVDGNDSTAAMSLNPGNHAGNVWLIAADTSWRDFNYDAFKLNNVKVTAAPGAVPEPATWAMMVGGFGLIGLGMRRRAADRAIQAI